MKASLVVLLGALLSVQAVKWTHVNKLKGARPAVYGQQSRIIGGEIAEKGQFPYIAAVFADDYAFNGASLISPSAVITVAHFVVGHTGFKVHLGVQKIYAFNDPDRVVVSTSDVIPHPKFQFGHTFNYDVAIVRFPEPVSGEWFSPIRLPAWSQKDTNFAEMMAITAGWGTIDDVNPNYSEDLRYVEVRVMSVAECQSHWGDVVVTGMNICAATNGGTVGICTGDAGGPLAVTEEDGEPTLVGVAIFGHPYGCEKEGANVYARTSEYLQWITENAPGVVIRP